MHNVFGAKVSNLEEFKAWLVEVKASLKENEENTAELEKVREMMLSPLSAKERTTFNMTSPSHFA